MYSFRFAERENNPHHYAQLFPPLNQLRCQLPGGSALITKNRPTETRNETKGEAAGITSSQFTRGPLKFIHRKEMPVAGTNAGFITLF